MEKVSQTLRQAREHRNLTLEEAAQRTRIPLSYLMALEGKGPNSRHLTRLLPDPLYLIPHLRHYAAFLDVDPNFIVTQFANEIQDAQEQNNRTAGLHQSPQILGPSPQRSRAISLSIVIASVLITLALIGQYSDLNPRAPSGGESFTVTPSTSRPGTSPLATPSPSATSSPTSSESSQAAPVPVPSPSAGQTRPSSSHVTTQPTPSLLTPSSPSQLDSSRTASSPSAAEASSSTARAEPAVNRSVHFLRAQAKEATWIRVLVEGQLPREMILQPGQSAVWTSDSHFLITLGNAGGVTLTVDGQELPPLGKSGQVLRNIRLPYSPTDPQG